MLERTILQRKMDNLLALDKLDNHVHETTSCTKLNGDGREIRKAFCTFILLVVQHFFRSHSEIASRSHQNSNKLISGMCKIQTSL